MTEKKIRIKKRVPSAKVEGQRAWYAVHTYAGYEEQVADALKQRAESLGMQDKIFNAMVPKVKEIEIRSGRKKTVEKRLFPGYVFVEMIVTEDSWYVVRNTPNVTGFVGFGVRPSPIKPPEIQQIKKLMGVEEPKYKIDLSLGDLVRIVDGPLKGFEGKVDEIDEDKGKIKVLVSMFGRETPVNLDFLQVKKV
jgi:transcriptional antiterminator NusG